MAIVKFATHKAATKESGWADGSYCPLRTGDDFPMVLWEEYVGKCVAERERNMYDDSDFYMTVYDENEGFKEIMFATTRGWSYPSYASCPDATDEVLSKYEEHKVRMQEFAVKRERKRAAEKLRELRKEVSKVARENNLPYAKFLRLIIVAKRKEVNILSVFGARVRSKFKLSIREQIINWLNETDPKYDFPLSPKQMMCL